MKYVLYLLLCEGKCASSILCIGPRLVLMSPLLISCCLVMLTLYIICFVGFLFL